jgi:RNA polymerase sigma-70 factor, ECF subfamily
VTRDAGYDQSSMVDSRAQPDAPPVGPSARLRELFELHAPYVWNTFRRLGAPPSDLEDLTHDLFLEVRRHLDKYDPARPVRPWLFGFAFRIASHHRRRAYRRRETPGDIEHERADSGVLADAALVAHQDRQLVLQALESIDLDRRAVFVLYEIDGEPMSEIAGVLGIPVNTAYSRLRAARAEFGAAVKRLVLRRGER